MGKHSTYVGTNSGAAGCIAAVLMEGRNTHLIPDGGDWVIIDGLIGVLKPFQKATEAMSGEKYSTISTVKPLLFKLLKVTLKVSDSDSPTNKRIKEVVSSDLSTRYDEGCIQQLLNVVTYLDPRYKNLPFLNESEKGKILQDVESMVMDHLSAVEAGMLRRDHLKKLRMKAYHQERKKAWSIN